MSFRALARELRTGVLDLLFAPVCLGCRGPIAPDARERLVCARCWARARVLPSPRCPRCAGAVVPLVPGSADASCSLCRSLPPSLRAVRSAFLLEGPVRELVHALKYGGWRDLAGPLGRRMAAVDLPREAVEEVRIVLPVPATRLRLRERGYNQAELLARAVALARGWQCIPDALVRDRSSGTQTALHPSERRANVAGAFRVGERSVAALARRHVLLVDDVWTTGATALACCEALVRGGARAVSVLTLARTPPDARRGPGSR